MQEHLAAAVVAGLYQSWSLSLLRYASTLSQTAHGAEDLVQEAFLTLQTRLVAGEEIRNPRAWTITVVRNLAHKQKRGSSKLVEMPRTPLLTPPDAQHTLALRQLLGHLTPREQDVLLLRMESLGYREIGEELGIATGTVAALLARALAKLREAAGRKAGEAKGAKGDAASR